MYNSNPFREYKRLTESRTARAGLYYDKSGKRGGLAPRHSGFPPEDTERQDLVFSPTVTSGGETYGKGHGEFNLYQDPFGRVTQIQSGPRRRSGRRRARGKEEAAKEVTDAGVAAVGVPVRIADSYISANFMNYLDEQLQNAYGFGVGDLTEEQLDEVVGKIITGAIKFARKTGGKLARRASRGLERFANRIDPPPNRDKQIELPGIVQRNSNKQIELPGIVQDTPPPPKVWNRGEKLTTQYALEA